MDAKKKLALLKSLRLLDHVPEDKLATLADFLEPRSFGDGQVVFEEGSRGDSLCFISAGHIRVRKKVETEGGPGFKDLAILGPGDCFGEMALLDEKAPRSARAQAAGDSVVFVLGRAELNRWLKSHPELALGFFAELVQVLSKRLRRSSNELALLFDLSRWLLEPAATGKELLQKVLKHMVPHLEGSWTAGAYLYNVFNAEMELVAEHGGFAGAAESIERPPLSTLKTQWLGDRAYLVVLPGKKRLEGYLLLLPDQTLAGEDKDEIGRTLGTAAGLIASAIENLNFRNEDSLRDRLKTNTEAYGPGL